jgi:hypothetical protein
MISNEELGNFPIEVDPISSFMDTSMDDQKMMERIFASRWNWYHVRHWNCFVHGIQNLLEYHHFQRVIDGVFDWIKGIYQCWYNI